MTWRTCFSDEARDWFAKAARAKGTDANRAETRFREVLTKRLEPYVPFGAESAQVTKIQDDLWELRRDSYRLFFGFVPGRSRVIIVSNVLPKKSGRLPQRVYDQESRRLATLMDRAVKWTLEC